MGLRLFAMLLTRSGGKQIEYLWYCPSETRMIAYFIELLAFPVFARA